MRLSSSTGRVAPDNNLSTYEGFFSSCSMGTLSSTPYFAWILVNVPLSASSNISVSISSNITFLSFELKLNLFPFCMSLIESLFLAPKSAT